MSDITITAEGLEKRYRIGQQEREGNLRNVIGPILWAPWKLLQRQKKKTFWALKDASLEVKQETCWVSSGETALARPRC